MVGTNRIKSVSEVQASPMELAEVKHQFCQMAKGEQVFWMESAQDESTGESHTFPTVPETIVDEMFTQAELCEIVLYK
jgi:hypothetical protein